MRANVIFCTTSHGQGRVAAAKAKSTTQGRVFQVKCRLSTRNRGPLTMRRLSHVQRAASVPWNTAQARHFMSLAGTSGSPAGCRVRRARLGAPTTATCSMNTHVTRRHPRRSEGSCGDVKIFLAGRRADYALFFPSGFALPGLWPAPLSGLVKCTEALAASGPSLWTST